MPKLTITFNSFRKILLLIVSILVCWSFLAMEAKASTGTVTGTVLTIRDGPGTQYAKKGSLLKGASVTIAEHQGSWLKIKLNSGLTGWVHADYVKTSSPSSSTSVVSQTSTGTVTCSVLNIRGAADSKSAKIGSLSKGTSVNIIGNSGSWLKISLKNGQIGWVHNDYVKVSPTTTVPSAPPPAPTAPSTPAESSVSQGSSTGTVTGSVVNVREGPGTQYNKKGSVSKGQKVKINASSTSWLNITLANGAVGWISAQYVKADTSTEKPVSNETTPEPNNGSSAKIEVTGSIVNLREGPGTHYLTRGQVNQGDQLELVEEQNGWYKVQTSRGIAWLAGGLARILTPPPAIAEEIESPATPVPPVKEPATPTEEIPLPGEIEPNPGLPYVPRVARIVLDPGHGGRDPGAIGITGSNEKDVNLAISNKTAELLRNADVEVIMTRSDDKYVTLNDRVDIANAANAAIFVSIHSNSTTNSETNGTMVYYYVDQNIPAAVEQASEREQLARIMQNSLTQNLGRADKGVRQNNYIVIRYTEIPAILVETAYLSNLTEEILLNDYAFQDRAAQAIANGVIEYFSSKGII